MSTKWGNNKTVEFQGINYIVQVINQSNCIFNKIDGSNDIGLDGYIEFIESGSATGLCIGVQIKSGNSYQSKDKQNLCFHSDKDHFDYWGNHILPIVCIVYIPETNAAYWFDITKYLNHKNGVEPPYIIAFPKEKNIFSLETFESFYSELTNYKDLYSRDWNFGKALKSILPENQIDVRIGAVKSLFYYHRNEIESWHYLIMQFVSESDFKIQQVLIIFLKHIISHGDIFWHPGNIVDQNIRIRARKIITKLFRKEEVAKLVSHIDEAGITRGSIGQDIYPLIDLVTEKVSFLKQIILDCDTSDEARYWSAIILINEFQHYDLDRAIKFAESMRTNFPESPYSDQFTIIKEALKHDNFVDFVG